VILAEVADISSSKKCSAGIDSKECKKKEVGVPIGMNPSKPGATSHKLQGFNS